MNLRWGSHRVPMGFRSKSGFIEHPSNIHRTVIEQTWECQLNVGEMSAEGVMQENAFRQAENLKSLLQEKYKLFYNETFFINFYNNGKNIKKKCHRLWYEWQNR